MEKTMAGELDDISVAIGSLQAQAKEHGEQNTKLFEKLEDIHKCVQSTQKDHHDRLTDLEGCKLVVDNDIKPQIKNMATEVHDIKEGMTKATISSLKSKVARLSVLRGVAAGGGGAGSYITKIFGG